MTYGNLLVWARNLISNDAQLASGLSGFVRTKLLLLCYSTSFGQSKAVLTDLRDMLTSAVLAVLLGSSFAVWITYSYDRSQIEIDVCQLNVHTWIKRGRT